MEPKEFPVRFLEYFAYLSPYFEHHLFCMAGQGSESSVDCGEQGVSTVPAPSPGGEDGALEDAGG